MKDKNSQQSTDNRQLTIKVAVLIASDRSHRGEREDISGTVLCDLLRDKGALVIDYTILPDEMEIIADYLIDVSDNKDADLILTSGGTGVAPRDVTPEATLAVIDREVPGIPETLRAKSLQISPNAMISRAAAGIRGKTLIINMPGSPKAVKECFEIVWGVIPHAMELLTGKQTTCQ